MGYFDDIFAPYRQPPPQSNPFDDIFASYRTPTPPPFEFDTEESRKRRELEAARLYGDEQASQLANQFADQPGTTGEAISSGLWNTGADIARGSMGMGSSIVEATGGISQAAGDQFGLDYMKKAGQETIRDVNTFRQWMAPEQDRQESHARNIALGVLENAPQIGLVAATGGAAIPVLGAIAGGQEYGQARAAGASPEAAGTSAALVMAIESGTEVLGSVRLVKRLMGELGTAKTVKEGVKNYLLDTALNSGQEAAADLGDRIARWATYSDKQFGKGWWEQTLEATAVGGIIPAGVHGAVANTQLKRAASLESARTVRAQVQAERAAAKNPFTEVFAPFREAPPAAPVPPGDTISGAPTPEAMSGLSEALRGGIEAGKIPGPRLTADMTREELVQALLVSKTGISSELAFNERQATQPHKAIVAVDMNDFGEANKLHGHAVGDALLELQARAFQQAGFDGAYHLHGDEFMLGHDGSEADIGPKLDAAKAWAAANPLIVEKDGQQIAVSVSFGHGIGTDRLSADIALTESKARAKAERRAAERAGSAPFDPGAVPQAPGLGEVQTPQAPEVAPRVGPTGTPNEIVAPTNAAGLTYLTQGITSKLAPAEEVKPMEKRRPTNWTGKMAKDIPESYSNVNGVGPVHVGATFTLAGEAEKTGNVPLYAHRGFSMPENESDEGQDGISVEREFKQAQRYYDQVKGSALRTDIEARGYTGSGNEAEIRLNNGRSVRAKHFDYLQRKTPGTTWVGQQGMSTVYIVNDAGRVVGWFQTEDRAGIAKANLEASTRESQPGEDIEEDIPEDTGEPLPAWLEEDVPARGSLGDAASVGGAERLVSEVDRGPRWAEPAEEIPVSRRPWFAQALPELVELATKILGEVPKIKRNLPGKLGVFRSGSKGRIDILASHAKNVTEFVRTVAHELGHAVDWMDSHNLDRGNVLGRIASLKNYFYAVVGASPTVAVDPLTPKERGRIRSKAEKMIPRVKGGDHVARAKEVNDTYGKLVQAEYERRGGLTKKVATAELIAVSQAMRPELWADGGNDYSKSGVELYADGFSLIMVNPNKFAQLAPTVWNAWQNYLENKPEVKGLLDEMMGRSAAGRDAVLEHRAENVQQMFKEGRQKTIDAALPEAKTWLDRLREDKNTFVTALIDKNKAIYALRRAAKKVGKGTAAIVNRAVSFMEEAVFANAEKAAMLHNTVKYLFEPLAKAGVELNDVSEIVFMRRAAGERGGDTALANPLGYNQEAAEEALGKIKERIGEKKFNAIKGFLLTWWNEVRLPLLQMLEASGAQRDDFIEKVLNNPEYARFQVQKFMEGPGQGTGFGVAFKKQYGTFEKINDPIIATILQDLSIVDLIHRTNTAKAVEEAVQSMGVWTPAETKYDANFQSNVPVESSDPKLGLITYMKDGKLVGYYAPRDIAKMFERDSSTIAAAGRFINKWTINTFFRGIYVVLNPMFAIRNVVKDFENTVKNLPGFHPLSLFRAYSGAAVELAPIMVRHALRGDPSFSATELIARHFRAIVTPGKLVLQAPDDTIETAFEIFAARSGYTDGTHLRAVRKPLAKFFDHLTLAMTTPTEFSERITKVAGWKYMEMQHPEMSPQQRADWVRNRIGTPNSYRRGSLFALTNNLFLFSNIAKEGWRSSWEAASYAPAAYAMKTAAFDIIPALVQAFAASGMLDDDDDEENKKLSKWYARRSESDRMNWTLIPWGVSEDGQSSVGLRIPHDHIGTFVHGVSFKLFEAVLNDEMRKSALQNSPTTVLTALAGQLPFTSMAPMWGVGNTLKGRVLGMNTLDSYRGKPEFTPSEEGSQSWEVWRKGLKVAWNKAASGLVTFQTDNIRSEAEGHIRSVLNMNLGKDLHGVERFLSVTNRGLGEKESAQEREEKQTKADESIKLDIQIARGFKALGPKASSPELFQWLKKNNIDAGSDYFSHYKRIRERLYPTPKLTM